MLKFASICPHPPIIVPTIGSSPDLEKVSKTIGALEKLAEIFAKSTPETVIVISPHGPVDFNYFTINENSALTGHFYNFGDFQTEFIFKNDLELINFVEKECLALRIPLRKVEIKELDHGTLVPLYYLGKFHSNFKVVPLSYSFLNLETHFQFGKVLQKIAEQSGNKKIAVVASGDLSHCLTTDAPGGFSPRAKEFDEKLIKLLKKKDIKGILNMPPDLVEEAGECGYRSIIILLGILSAENEKGGDWYPEILSYECPFGVGYLVANFKLEK